MTGVRISPRRPIFNPENHPCLLYLKEIQIQQSMTKDELQEIVSKSKSKTDVCRLVWGYINGRNNRKLNELLDEYQIDISHFDSGADKHRKYEKVTKICPVCSNEFEALKNKREKQTCSHSCSNSFFRSGINHPNWKESAYRTTCFKNHKKMCVICEEFRIVDVHHLDENKSNNKPENLVPLCRTHHAYWHSRYRNLIKPQILEYVTQFKASFYKK